jgi:HSP20 family protein
MASISKRTPTSPLNELMDWLESGRPALTDWRREGSRTMRIEDELTGDAYLVRAEIPGVDPDRDVHVNVSHGVLTITAERREESRDTSRSEFHYGSFLRRVTLPEGADDSDISATYGNGILEVSVPIVAGKESVRDIPIARRPAD